VSKEKSQFENVTMPTAEGGMAKKKTGPTLSAGFALGQNLEKEPPVSRAETVKNFVPSHQSQADREAEEEKEIRIQIEKEGMNYDLYLLIKDKMVGEFEKNIEKSRGIASASWFPRDRYELLKKSSLPKLIEENSEIYTPNSKDLRFIVKNLKDFFPKIEESDYPTLGVFLNVFIHAYFNSVDQEKREDLNLLLSNTKNLDFVGTELNFGKLEVEDAGDYFGYYAHGKSVLCAKKVGDSAGYKASDRTLLEIDEAGNNFGKDAHGNSILKARKVGNTAGYSAFEESQIIITEEAGNDFGRFAREEAILKARKVGSDAGYKASGKVQILVEEAGDYFGREAYGDAVLVADRVGDHAGKKIRGNASITVNKEAGDNFGDEASDRTVLKAKKVGNFAGCRIKGSAQMEVEEANSYFGLQASDRTVLKAKKVGIMAGNEIKGNAQITITESYDLIGGNRQGDSQIILPDGRILKAGDEA
jgi:hypothetical protein